jgi:molybdenum cofactor guanylyltransferase
MIGFVQAGGGSTRFGRDKALVQLAGQTMLARTVELVASVCDSVQIVAPTGKYTHPGATLLADRYPGEGPLGGILTALLAMQLASTTQSWALIVSCDMPFLSEDFLAFLGARASQGKSQVLVPESFSGLEPLCACWHASAFPSVQAAFDSGVRKVTEVMKRLPMEVLDESVWKRFDTEGRLFWNINTPEDFEWARRILEKAQVP